MSKPTPATLAEEVLASKDEIVRLGPRLHELLEAAFAMSTNEALDQLGNWLPSVEEAIERRIRKYRAAGRTPPFVWVDAEARDMLVHPAVAITDPLEATRVRQVLRSRGPLLQAMGELSGEDFEHLCTLLLGLNGIPPRHQFVTNKGGDGGIDFVGLYEGNRGSAPARLRNLSFRVVGQAKRRRQSIVDTDDIDAFAWRLSRWRLGVGRGWLSLPDWFREAADLPILGLFVTAGRFTDSAKRTAIEIVSVFMDGEQIAEDLVLSERFAGWCESSGEFSPALFGADVAGYKSGTK